MELASEIIRRVNRFTSHLREEESGESHLNAYLYGTLKILNNLLLTTGVAVNAIDRDSDDRNVEQGAALDRTTNYISPKVGVIWEPFASTRLRAG